MLRCLSCKTEPAPGKARCRACLERSAAASNAYRQRHPDRVKFSNKRARDKFLSEGICPQCRERPILKNRTRCIACLDDHRSGINEKRRDRAGNGKCRECGSPLSGNMSHCASCLKRISDRNTVLRNEILSAYGGRCACCGETERIFLQIDHKNGGGRSDRKSGLYSATWYRWLKRHEYPSDYQILCANCNWGKHLNGGICPHQSNRKRRS